MMTGINTGARAGDAARPANEPALVCREAEVTQPYHYWLGASGSRYLHTVFPLLECPLMPKVNYILVRRGADGVRCPLEVGQTVSDADSLNLAHLRHRAARLGANEIHVHFLSATAGERAAVEADLATRQLGHTRRRRTFNAANDHTETVCA